jgi:pimeloyl-ACP methyl ester carboxylesterase
MVLLHAFPLSADQWLPQLHRVPAGWRYVAPDLRGFRGTGPAFEDRLEGATIDTYAADVLELMTHLEIEDAVVAGLSMGGYVAFSMVRQASSRVSGLVLANTRATADSPDARDGRDRMLELLERDGPLGIGRDMAPKLLGPTTLAEQPDLSDAIRRLVEMNSPDAIGAAIRALKDRQDSTAMLPSITCGTTIVCGGEDALIPVADGEAMHAAIPGSRLVVLPRAGHLSNLEDPPGFREALELSA